MNNCYISELEALKLKINSAADCGIITSDVNRRYLTGMKSSAGTLVVFPEKAYFIIDFRYIEKAQNLLNNNLSVEVVLQKNLFEQINTLIKKHCTKTIAIESDQMFCFSTSRI